MEEAEGGGGEFNSVLGHEKIDPIVASRKTGFQIYGSTV